MKDKEPVFVRIESRSYIPCDSETRNLFHEAWQQYMQERGVYISKAAFIRKMLTLL